MTTCPFLLTLLLALTILMPTARCFTVPSRCSRSRDSTPHFVAAETIQAVETAAEVDLYTSASVLAQMDAFWQSCPYTAAALVCGFKGSMADVIAQTTSDTASTTQDSPPVAVLSSSPLDELDFKRNLVFLLYGALYQGMVHEYVFNTLYPAWFGTGTEASVVLIKVLFNLFVQTTLVTLPVAYILKAFIMNDDHTDEPLQSALDKYWQDIQHRQLLTKCFALWGPVQCITFSVVPEHYRVTFIAVVSFFWLIILSNISNDENEQQGPLVAAPAKE